MVKIFKFGGASIKDVERIKHIGRIIKKHRNERLVIVFSAMGKVTNMLEEVVDAYIMEKNTLHQLLSRVKKFHIKILEELFDRDEPIFDEVNNFFVEIEWVIDKKSDNGYDYEYDQIVSIGELLSSKIMSAYLDKEGFENVWIDARDIIRTDNTYRNAKVDWSVTVNNINNNIKESNYITQGFIGCTSENFTTTLGREGSDFTAAILAFALNSNEVTIWKDVPGMMNADPQYFEDAELISNISFDEAIELAFFGAKVIHPKTIQPLKKKGIPLKVKSFINLSEKGTLIGEGPETGLQIPSYIIKRDQVLISISDPSLSFIIEDHMSQIFHLLSKYSIRVNMMQNSAVSFSICVDEDKYKIPELINSLQKDFKVFYNKNLNLYTIRNYTLSSLKELTKNKKIILEQRTRNTVQIVACRN